MPTTACDYCENAINFNGLLASIKCPHCNQWTATGLESGVRDELEKFASGAYPQVTTARAMALSCGIYKTASKGRDEIRMVSVGKKLKKLGKGGKIVFQSLFQNRSHGGYTDPTTGAAVVVIDNGDVLPKYSIFVVFRGSVGMTLFNKTNAGFDEELHNVDWRANLDNPMETCPWAGEPIRMHRGFIQIVGSYKEEIYQCLKRTQILDSTHVVVTGHSQGAAHAIVFSHWLAYHDPGIRLLCMPFSPPRVGNEYFARDFNTKIYDRSAMLPYDGFWSYSAYLMVRGQDPVSHNVKHAFTGNGIGNLGKIADKRAPITGILAKKNFATKAEGETAIMGDIYFHPKSLVVLPEIKVVGHLNQGFNHQPKWFRSLIMGKLEFPN